MVIPIFNLNGQLVVGLVNDNQNNGAYEIQWNGTDETGYNLSSGTYILQLITKNNVLSRPITLLK